MTFRHCIVATFALVLLLAGVSEQAIAGRNRCSRWLKAGEVVNESWGDQRLKVWQPRQPVDLSDDGWFERSQVFRDPNQVILGVTDWGHFFLIAGDLHLDGGILTRQEIIEAEGRAYGGYLFVFQGLSREKISNLQEVIQSEDGIHCRACISSALAAVEGGLGYEIGDGQGFTFSLEETFRRLLVHGFKDGRGQRVPMRILRTNGLSVSEMIQRMAKLDRSIPLHYLASYGKSMAVCTVLLGVSACYWQLTHW